MKIQIQGILNCTPNSFSDGGLYLQKDDAIKQAEQLIKDGADIIDIGGESTGPGSVDVDLETETNRVIPVIKAIRSFSNICISVDTCKAEVAKKALEAGANIVNDVTGASFNPEILKVVNNYNAKIIIMHSKDKHPRTTIRETEYKDIIKTIINFFSVQIQNAKKIGLSDNQIILDPGMGHFISANPKYSYEIIARLKEIKNAFPNNKLLVGISRKSFMGGDLKNRDDIAKQLHRILKVNGADILRVHNIEKLKEALTFTN